MLVYANTLNIPKAKGSTKSILGAMDSWLRFKTRKALNVTDRVNQPAVRLCDGKELEVVVSGTDSSGGIVLGSVVFSHPDGKVAGRKWFTRVGFRIPPEAESTVVSIVLETSDISVQSGSSPVFATRPGVVRSLVEGCGLSAPSPPMEIDELSTENVEAFAADLERPERSYAIVLLSREPFSERYYVNPTDVLSQVVGLARVVTIPNKAHTKTITDAIGRRFSSWGGAINVIMPALRNGFIPNILITPDQLRYETGRDKSPELYLLYLLTHRLNLPHFRREITAAAVRQHSLALRLEKLRAEQQSAGQLHELLSLVQMQVEQQQVEIDRLKDENAKAWSEWEEADQRAAQVSHLRDQIATYRKSFETLKREGRLASENPVPVTTVGEAIDAAKDLFALQLVFSLNAKSDGENSPFQAPEEVFQAFEWLAGTYFESKTGKVKCADLDQSLAEAVPGWHYSAHQKEATMKACKEWYQCPWEGAPNGRLWIPEHLKGGAARSRRPEETIRIAFAWESNAKRVVVGFIGQHQENTRS